MRYKKSKIVSMESDKQYPEQVTRSLHAAAKERMLSGTNAGLLSAKFMINSVGVSSLQSFRKPAINFR
jgi:hypothetical protein